MESNGGDREVLRERILLQLEAQRIEAQTRLIQIQTQTLRVIGREALSNVVMFPRRSEPPRAS